MEVTCKAHSGLEEKLTSIDTRLARIEQKLEPLGVIGNMASENRSWLRLLTGGFIAAFLYLMGWREL